MWKPASQQSLWDSTRLPEQLESRRDLEEPFQNTPKASPAPQQPQASPTEAQPSTDVSLPIAVLKAAAGEPAGSSASEVTSEQPTAGGMQHAVDSAEGKGSDAVTIPYDWEVSIGPDGAAKVEGGAGSLTVVPRAAEEPKSARAPGAKNTAQPHGRDGSSKSNSSGSNGASLACSHAQLCGCLHPFTVISLFWMHAHTTGSATDGPTIVAAAVSRVGLCAVHRSASWWRRGSSGQKCRGPGGYQASQGHAGTGANAGWRRSKVHQHRCVAIPSSRSCLFCRVRHIF